MVQSGIVTRCQAHERDSLERLCRYIARPAVSNERLSVNDRGQVVYRLKRVFHIDIERCEVCGGTLRVIACIDTPEIIKRILTHLAVREADRIHNPRAPPSELAQRAEPLRAPAAELPVSPSPTVP